MYGFPGFELAGPESNGSTTYSPVRQVETPTSVSLSPGKSAHAWFTFLNQADSCDTGGMGWVPTTVLLTPPDDTASITLTWVGQAVDNCQGAATHPGTYIGAIEPGPPGTYTS
jgi:hypothetical protein